jgi:hypothetical protein
MEKFQFGLAIVLCVLGFTMATAQTILMNGFHPAIILFWAMAFLTTAILRITKKELEDEQQKRRNKRNH